MFKKQLKSIIFTPFLIFFNDFKNSVSFDWLSVFIQSPTANQKTDLADFVDKNVCGAVAYNIEMNTTGSLC